VKGSVVIFLLSFPCCAVRSGDLSSSLLILLLLFILMLCCSKPLLQRGLCCARLRAGGEGSPEVLPWVGAGSASGRI